MISVAEALQRVLDSVKRMPTETVTLAAAHGRVLAQDVIARLTQPPTDVSAMDGYAVQAKDVAGAFLFLASAESTTGMVITVDGGDTPSFVR